MTAFKRVAIIAPTRSTCVNIDAVLRNLDLPITLLIKEKGGELFDAVSHLGEGGFGVVAGTGTGKTVSIRDMCRRVLSDRDLRIDIVTREHEATDYTWTCNVLVITPGVALHWLKAGVITKDDLVVIDEIHQTSEHLELSMALAKRAGCSFVWMSATIDSEVYKKYLKARTVITCEAFDSSRQAQVECCRVEDISTFLRDKVDEFVRERRGVAVFVPTRTDAEGLARELNNVEGLNTEFYHGGESAEKLRAFLTGEVQKPFVILMTIAGASSLNIVGLDTVVIVDEWFTEVVRSGGVKSLEKQPLGPNELLQMAGRVNGRAVNGKIYILTSRRNLDLKSLKPIAPRFALGGDLERVALTCAHLGIDARDLDIIGSIDRRAYERVLTRFQGRGLIHGNGDSKLTELGKKVERLPVQPSWGEILVKAEEDGNKGLFNIVVVAACTDQLFKLTRREWNRNCGLVVRGSDHLTAYNIVATAFKKFGRISESYEGLEYRFSGDWISGYGADRQVGAFIDWCDENGFVAKEIKNIALAIKSVYRQTRARLPDPISNFPVVVPDSALHRKFIDVVARVQSLDFVQYEQNSFAGTVWANSGSVASATYTLGSIRFFKDQKGYTRSTIEGTEIPTELVKLYTSKKIEGITSISADGERVRVRYSGTFAGEKVAPFEDELGVDEIPEPYAKELPRIFARWVARGDCEGTLLAEITKKNSGLVRKAQNLNTRAGGSKIFETYDSSKLYDFYVTKLGGARCVSEIKDIEALQLPPLNEARVAEVERENPEDLEVCGQILKVINDYRHDLYIPVITLSGEVVTEHHVWKKLPDRGVFLPGGREVQVVVRYGATAYNYAADTNIPRLKEKLREYFNHNQWVDWKRPDYPPDLKRLEEGEDEFPGITKMEYGRCIMEGTPLYAYGAVVLNPRYFSSARWFKWEWYKNAQDAKEYHKFARDKFVALQAEAGDRRELEDARVAATNAQDELGEFVELCEEYMDELDPELSERLTNLGSFMPSNARFDALQNFIQECTAVIAEVDTAVKEIDNNKGGKSSFVSQKKEYGDDETRLLKWAGKKKKR